VLGGAQSLHTNSYDEALSLPTEEAAALALRTQLVLAHETGVANSVDPLGGAYLVERLTTDLEKSARDVIGEIDALGGVLPALESGYFHREIASAAYAYQRAVEKGEIAVVGLGALGEAEGSSEGGDLPDGGAPRAGAGQEEAQRARLAAWRAARDGRGVADSLARLERAARGAENLLPMIIDAVRAGATLGEIASRLRVVFGSFREKAAF
jgi:methylmalonyl-CoA mutase N-terminal domain/subunit